MYQRPLFTCSLMRSLEVHRPSSSTCYLMLVPTVLRKTLREILQLLFQVLLHQVKQELSSFCIDQRWLVTARLHCQLLAFWLTHSDNRKQIKLVIFKKEKPHFSIWFILLSYILSYYYSISTNIRSKIKHFKYTVTVVSNSPSPIRQMGLVLLVVLYCQ